jgi:hypothetical protein
MLSWSPSFSCPNEWVQHPWRLEHIDLYQKGCDQWSPFFHFRLGEEEGGRVLDNIDKWYILRKRVLYIMFRKRCKKRKEKPHALLRENITSSKTIATFQWTAPILGVSKVSCLWWVHFQFQVSNTKYLKDLEQTSSIKYQGFKQRQAILLMDSKARRKRIRV